MKVTFLIDGFNLYHSLLDAESDHGIKAKWLNIHSLMSSYLPNIDKSAVIEEVYFFTALRNHVRSHNPQTVKRHERYLKMLQSTGVQVIKGKFKQGTGYCNSCRSNFRKYEEKETDVNIAVKLVELAFLKKADAFVIVSGDTDLMPGVDTVNKLFPDKPVYVIFPYGRKNDDYKSRVKASFKLNKEAYLRHLFPDPVTLKEVTYTKPIHW